MWIIPIIYKLKYDSDEFNQNEILDLLEAYLTKLNFRIINRKENYIFYHKGGIMSSPWNFRDLIGSGSIKIKVRKNKIIITLKHSLVFLILLLFAILYLLITSSYSTFDSNDKELFTGAFVWLFGASYIIKIIAHYRLKRKLNELVIRNLKIKTPPNKA